MACIEVEERLMWSICKMTFTRKKSLAHLLLLRCWQRRSASSLRYRSVEKSLDIGGVQLSSDSVDSELTGITTKARYALFEPYQGFGLIQEISIKINHWWSL